MYQETVALISSRCGGSSIQQRCLALAQLRHIGANSVSTATAILPLLRKKTDFLPQEALLHRALPRTRQARTCLAFSNDSWFVNNQKHNLSWSPRLSADQGWQRASLYPTTAYPVNWEHRQYSVGFFRYQRKSFVDPTRSKEPTLAPLSLKPPGSCSVVCLM